MNQANTLKVWRKRSDLRDFFGRADQYILIFVIQPAQGADYVTRISSDAEFGHSPDIDRDLHEGI